MRSRAAAWTPTKEHLTMIDNAQLQFIRYMLKSRPQANETIEAFALRRSRLVAKTVQQQWSRVAAECSISWLSHMQRHTDCFPYRSFREQDSGWLNARRFEHTYPGDTSKIRSRATRGRVMRWDHNEWTQRYNPRGSRYKKVLRNLSRRLLDDFKIVNRERSAGSSLEAEIRAVIPVS